MLILCASAVIFVFLLRDLTVHVYNYGVTGYFMGNTYGQVNTLTNVMYACDEEDREVFEEGDLEQAFFDNFYGKAMDQRLNYVYAGENFDERAAYLEEHHDILKFRILEAELSAYYFGLGEVDYYEQSSMSDEMAGRMIKKLLPACFGQWLYDYILLCRNGFVRSIAVVHPFLNFAALFLYVLAAGLLDGGVQLLADIGTNGEMALAKDGRLLCCSTAAGLPLRVRGSAAGCLPRREPSGP